jgi:2,4-diketo-3-deoxy-L-fuconate hydrolase
MLTKNTTYDDDRVPGESDEQRYQRFYAMMDERSRDGTPYFWTGLHSSLVGPPTMSSSRRSGSSTTGSWSSRW